MFNDAIFISSFVIVSSLHSYSVIHRVIYLFFIILLIIYLLPVIHIHVHFIFFSRISRLLPNSYFRYVFIVVMLLHGIFLCVFCVFTLTFMFHVYFNFMCLICDTYTCDIILFIFSVCRICFINVCIYCDTLLCDIILLFLVLDNLYVLPWSALKCFNV